MYKFHVFNFFGSFFHNQTENRSLTYLCLPSPYHIWVYLTTFSIPCPFLLLSDKHTMSKFYYEISLITTVVIVVKTLGYYTLIRRLAF